jgi:hypothetical protein
MQTSFWKTIKVSSAIFWTHWLVAVMGHVFIVLMPIGAIQLIIENNNLGFFVKGMLLGMLYLSLMYGANHIGNSDGFCVLTWAENYYREKEGLPHASKRFVHRFYRKNRELWQVLKNCMKH